MVADAGLATRLERLPGVGTARGEKLAKLGLTTVRDALMHFPREYRDFSGAHALADLREGEHASIVGDVTDVGSRTLHSGRTMLTVILDCGGGRARAVWFSMPFMAKRFAKGMRVVVAGQPRLSSGTWEFAHPDVRWLAGGEEAHASDWLAVYPLAEGVQQSHVRLAVQAALDHAAGACPEALPEEMLAAKDLLAIEQAFREIHCPSSREMIGRARRRFVYQELLMLQLALRMHRSRQQRAKAAPAIPVDLRLDARIRARFPFEFTPAQKRVCAELAADMARTEPMNRLLQGDVGSGKTAVAVYAMLAAVGTRVAADSNERFQAAIMAPTGLLARQHHQTLSRLLAGSGVEVELLVGGQTAKRREAALERIAAGTAGIVVGTQALVAGAARFRHLALVVIDEQHRFGVLQRAVLQQGQADPHTLVMTATPIPRTIAHAVYGDLDVSTLDEPPPGRQPVATYRVGPDDLDRWWEFVRKKLAGGRRGYVVVPAVEESKRDLATIASAYEALANGPLEAFRLGLVHGRLQPTEKAAVMEEFRGGRLDVLVATSVIEVGIDVPEATIMTILDAESFGLAQLHQLRGRVARGATQGICGAVMSSQGEPHPRVDAFVATTDGFTLAETDLRLRGPGDLVGTRQSGMPPLYLADLLRDGSVVAEARRDALELFEKDPALADPSLERLRKLILDRWGATLGLGEVA
ncbi:MAG: ATP-dependent DNA helicase RecG [Planctomycetes bacterium]|nr:ATP-dependent DNA helicase RecG [Planctomycetota bacterium]